MEDARWIRGDQEANDGPGTPEPSDTGEEEPRPEQVIVHADGIHTSSHRLGLDEHHGEERGDTASNPENDELVESGIIAEGKSCDGDPDEGETPNVEPDLCRALQCFILNLCVLRGSDPEPQPLLRPLCVQSICRGRVRWGSLGQSCPSLRQCHEGISEHRSIKVHPAWRSCHWSCSSSSIPDDERSDGGDCTDQHAQRKCADGQSQTRIRGSLLGECGLRRDQGQIDGLHDTGGGTHDPSH